MIENVDKYLVPKDPDEISNVRESVLSQFGPDYCVIAANAAFRMMVSYFLMGEIAAPNPDAMKLLAKIHGSVIKEAIIGAGFSGEDAIKIIIALKNMAVSDD